MIQPVSAGGRAVFRVAAILVIGGLLANIGIGTLLYGESSGVFPGWQDWAADFIKHVL